MNKSTGIFKKITSGIIVMAMIGTISIYETPVNQVKADAIIVNVATDTSDAVYKNLPGVIICINGAIPGNLRTDIQNGGKTFRFAPGEYLIEGSAGSLLIGNNTLFEGIENIVQPLNFKEVMVPNKNTMAVFATRTEKLSSEQASSNVTGSIQTKTYGKNVNIKNIAMQGHCYLKLDNASDTNVTNVLINNYRGTYPNGNWCNMGYSATATLWLYGRNTNVNLTNCQVQFSSHHGLSIHSGDSTSPSKDILFKNCRALYCGCGQLRGDNTADITSSQNALPQYDGRGYMDWSTAFDLCENTPIENVTVEDCYALEGWKTNFYTEPEETNNAHITNLVFRRCRSEGAGQRNVIPNVVPKTTFARECENANYFLQGGYLEDCISVNGEKTGFYLDSNRLDANATGGGLTKLVRCIDLGSPVSLCTEMFDCKKITCDSFVSLNATKAAFWIFGGNPVDSHPGDNFIFTNSKILAKTGQTVPVIKIGYMIRQGFIESPNAGNLFQTTSKYAKLRSHMTYSSFDATVYGLASNVETYEVASAVNSSDKKAATFRTDDKTDGVEPNNGITVIRGTGTLNVGDYVNDYWGRAKYTVQFNSNGGSAVASKTAYDSTTVTAPANPKRAGFTFTGWYSSKTGGTKAVFPLTIKNNITIYARWKVITPGAPSITTIKRTASKTINLKWKAVKYAVGYQVYRSTSKTGTFKLIATTKILSYTNKKLIAGKTYYFKIRCYNLNGTVKVYSKMSLVKNAKA
ncbi:MAG: InlB B-repeat-containing protein [Clostridia bacterium]|jgi:uncharacterized repeat protein (TIGR02543 family)